VLHQLVQITGALIILVGFVAAQRGRLDAHGRTYLALNVAGSAILGADAWYGREWGFLLLEGVWAVVSAHGLARALRGRAPVAAH
jgi:hypothetical protein